jgi:predicted nuclease with TOPRIM domain
MFKQKNLTEDELKLLQVNVNKLNQVHIELGRLENQKHKILHQMGETEKEFDELQQNIEKKYGKCSINIENGELSEIEQKEDIKEFDDNVTLITENDVVDLLNVSKVTLNSWRKNNILKEHIHYIRIGTTLRYKKESLLNFNEDE